MDQLPENSTWDDLMHEIYRRQSIERGLADSEAGRTTGVEEVRDSLGSPSESRMDRPRRAVINVEVKRDQ
ncbi:MAG: hypothetical protein AABN34_26145 [Acidobacteriota bacterium]